MIDLKKRGVSIDKIVTTRMASFDLKHGRGVGDVVKISCKTVVIKLPTGKTIKRDKIKHHVEIYRSKVVLIPEPWQF